VKKSVKRTKFFLELSRKKLRLKYRLALNRNYFLFEFKQKYHNMNERSDDFISSIAGFVS
jgi:hypothetical protein